MPVRGDAAATARVGVDSLPRRYDDLSGTVVHAVNAPS
jgi:hypothetical protein